MPRPLRSGLIGLVTVLCLAVTACGSEESGSSDEPDKPKASATEASPTDQASPSTKKPSGTTINITFKGDKVDPNGVEKKVEAGKPINLHIVADAPGEIHVHSSPEQEIEYPKGTSDKTLKIDQPGVVEVESHHLDTVIVQLEVR